MADELFAEGLRIPFHGLPRVLAMLELGIGMCVTLLLVLCQPRFGAGGKIHGAGIAADGGWSPTIFEILPAQRIQVMAVYRSNLLKVVAIVKLLRVLVEGV